MSMIFMDRCLSLCVDGNVGWTNSISERELNKSKKVKTGFVNKLEQLVYYNYVRLVLPADEKKSCFSVLMAIGYSQFFVLE